MSYPEPIVLISDTTLRDGSIRLALWRLSQEVYIELCMKLLLYLESSGIDFSLSGSQLFWPLAGPKQLTSRLIAHLGSW